MEEKRVHWKPNLFDVLIVILVVAIVGTAYYLSHRDTGSSASAPSERTFLLELSDLEIGMEGAVSVGDSVTDNNKSLELGEVTAVEVIPATATLLDQTAGQMIQAPVEDRITLLVTIRAETVEYDERIETVSGYALRVGTQVSCTLGDLAGTGYILEVER